ncbi:MAG TPA: glycosyltransferase family 4 protein [Candidatus Krumholzibacteria bacterium]|nr:glycosyltransferase family 4 protein [Candidatus Krumholzibacteria bacterium]
MIRICYVVDAPFLGGAELYISRLISALDRGAFATSVLMRRDVRDARLVEWADALRGRGTGVVSVPMRLPWVPADAWRIYRALDALAPHIVHVNVPGPYDGQFGLVLPIARATGARTVVTEHLPMVPPLWKRALVKRIGYRALDVAVTMTRANAGYLVEKQGVPSRKVRVVANGIPRAFGAVENAAQRRWELGLKDSQVLVAYVGNILPHKGLRRLIEAMSRAGSRASLHLVVAGTGSDEAACRQLAADRGLAAQVTFLGWRSSSETEAILAASDVLALPSEWEGLPYVLLEAMACARPVIAGRVFGIPEVVDDGVTGVLVDPLRIDEIAHALDRLGDAALREKMGAAARTRFERLFTLEIQAARMQALYRSLVNGSTARGAA